MHLRCTGVNPCFRMGHGRIISTLAIAMNGEMCHLDSEVVVSKPRSTTWSNSLIIGIYPARVLMSPPSKSNVITVAS